MTQVTHADLVHAYRSRFPQRARRVGSEWKGPCPVCGGTDRFHIAPSGASNSGKPFLIGCRHCGKSREAYEAQMRALGMWGNTVSVEFEAERQRRDEQQKELRRRGRKNKAKKMSRQVNTLLRASVVAKQKTPAWAYLVEQRAVWPHTWRLPACVRWIPTQSVPGFAGWCGTKSEQEAWRTCAGLVTFIAHNTLWVQVEALQADGRRIEPRRRRTYGLAKADVLTLHGPSDLLHICEGPVTALALYRAFGGADSVVCAGGGVGGDAMWRHTRGFDKVIIHAEGDTAGLRGATELAIRLPHAKVSEYPAGIDAADLVQEHHKH